VVQKVLFPDNQLGLLGRAPFLPHDFLQIIRDRSDTMTNTTETPATPQKPDGILTTQTDNQTFIIEVFFDHDSKETFQDKLLRSILAEESATG
jgi:hypothetical protein